MGRKGMKSFMKSAARPSTKPDDEEEASATAAGTSPAAPAATAATTTSSSKAPAAAGAAAAGAQAAAHAGSNDDGRDGSQNETKGKMLQRHKREMLAHKKAVQRMGKKSKDELAKLDAEIEARHARELQDLEAAEAAAAAAGGSSAAAAAATAGAGVQQAAASADGSAAVADSASKYLKDLSVGGEEREDEAGGKGKKQSKAQRRREKAAAKDAEREARIAAELAELGPSERATEEGALQELLLPMGLLIKEIRADGHCLYRSLEDQLQQTAAAAGSSAQQQQYSYQQLRELAADYIRQHRDQFAPFLLPEDESTDTEEYYEQYCDTLENTAAWGGHLELTALSAVLQRHIKVHAVGMDTINIGDAEYGDKPALEVCYLRHAFGLGEHYNSTIKLSAALEKEGHDEEGEDAAEDASSL